MNLPPRAATLLAFLLAACASSTPPAPPPLLATRLSPEWLSQAKRVQSGSRVIYYRGAAQNSQGAEGARWSGTVSGDILALDAASAIVVTGGSLTITPGQAIRVAGQNEVVTSDRPVWKHLLAR